MNRGGVGARSLNIELQAALNPAGEQKVLRFGWIFAPGDKVMQIQNDYDKEVYNGDIGYVDEVDLDDGELVASFDGRAVSYAFGELDTLVPAYAATIHKSQGSEYPCRCDSGHDAALRHAATKSTLYWCHPRQEVGCACRSEEGCRHRCSECLWAQAVVKIK
jgi:hypothetical protein